METTNRQKTFDAVKMMRDIRTKISDETQNMSFEELKAYIKKQLTESKAKLVGQREYQHYTQHCIQVLGLDFGAMGSWPLISSGGAGHKIRATVRTMSNNL